MAEQNRNREEEPAATETGEGEAGGGGAVGEKEEHRLLIQEELKKRTHTKWGEAGESRH